MERKKNLTGSFWATTGGQWWRKELTEVRLHSPAQKAEASSVYFVSSLLVSSPSAKALAQHKILRQDVWLGCSHIAPGSCGSSPQSGQQSPTASAIWECQPGLVSQTPPPIKGTGSEWLPWRGAPVHLEGYVLNIKPSWLFFLLFCLFLNCVELSEARKKSIF